VCSRKPPIWNGGDSSLNYYRGEETTGCDRSCESTPTSAVIGYYVCHHQSPQFVNDDTRFKLDG